MPTCNDCGREVDPEWNVCPDCGHSLSAADTAADTDQSAAKPAEPGEAGDAASSGADASGPTRRALVGSLVAGLGMGALGWGAIRLLEDADHDSAGGDAWSDRSVASTDAGRVIRGTVTLDPGTYVAERFTVSGGARIGTRITRVDGGAFDVYGVRASQFGDYRDGGSVEFVPSLSQAGIERPRGMFGNPPADDYVLVVDNTTVYNAEPDGTLSVDVEMGVGDF